MARAYRHFIPGYIWHITHRCHKRDFLLKFAKDRNRRSGYHEIQHPKDRYRLIDHNALQRFLNVDSNEALATSHSGWISSQLKEQPERQKHFVESIAVAGEPFISKLQTILGINA